MWYSKDNLKCDEIAHCTVSSSHETCFNSLENTFVAPCDFLSHVGAWGKRTISATVNPFLVKIYILFSVDDTHWVAFVQILIILTIKHLLSFKILYQQQGPYILHPGTGQGILVNRPLKCNTFFMVPAQTSGCHTHHTASCWNGPS